MANELTASRSTAPALGQRTLSSLALSLSAWTTTDAMAMVAGPSDIDEAKARIRMQLAPVPADQDARDSWLKAMDERLRRIAGKISPGMSPAQANVWRDLMCKALADLPAMVALTATKRAFHVPMQYLNEVEGVIRDIAAQVIRERNLAMSRLDSLREQMQRGSAPRLDTRATDFEGWTIERLRDLPRFAAGSLLRAGAITQEQYDEAFPASEDAA